MGTAPGYTGPGGAWVSPPPRPGNESSRGIRTVACGCGGTNPPYPRAWHHGGSVTNVCFVPGRARGGARAGTRAGAEARAERSWGETRGSPRRASFILLHAASFVTLRWSSFADRETGARVRRGRRGRRRRGSVSRRVRSGRVGRAPGTPPRPEIDVESAMVASASTDADVKIWDVATGAHLATLRGHVDVVWHVRDTHPLVAVGSRCAVVTRSWRLYADARGSSPSRMKVLPRSSPAARGDRPERVMLAHDDAVLSLAVWEEHAVGNGAATRSNRSRICRRDGGAVSAEVTGSANGRRRVTAGTRTASSRRNSSVERRVTLGRVCDTSVRRHRSERTLISSRRCSTTARPCAQPSRHRDGARHSRARGRRWRTPDARTRTNTNTTWPSESHWWRFGRSVRIPRPRSTATAKALNVDGAASVPLAMDGAGSGFSSCVAFDGEVLAVGTKTGTIQILDFRANDAESIA